MTTLIESYEQQYSSLSADITVSIGKISNTIGGEKQANIRHVDKLFDELAELLEQMELEIKDLPAKDKQKYRTRLASYKAENKKLLADMKRAKLGLNAREELLGEECNDSEDQRTRLLDNTEKLERGSRRLQDGYRVVMETEQMGAQILTDLQDQRETIQRSRNRLEETNTALGKSSRVLSGMAKRIIQNRILLVVVILVILFVIVMAIYLTVTKKS
ncbi:vesicle transport through interaction with t-SNAREs homolog 1A-like [Ruditapes philippinarum]|uniref:vesicle transport through interaction with t-SNAREs homolog 1A-like n=1 Tax=Ruditapes philippinarum TaxID=129788 RepID=UPI00295B012A|nr:vesicle transport through interaction with t-SNAREs homolog 1A-like [Ruditapes philippinarum]